MIDFRLVAPLLDNYSYTLFTLWQRADGIYPLRVVSAPWSSPAEPLDDEQIANEAQLTALMKSAFSHPKATAVIRNLMASSQAMAS